MVQSRAGQGTVQIALRLPPELRDAVKASAEGSGRSINSEIIALVEQALYEDNNKDEILLWQEREAAEAEKLREIVNKQDDLLRQFRVTNRNFIILSKAVGQALLDQDGASDFLKTLATALISFEEDFQSLED